MTPVQHAAEWFARFRHPKLAALATVGVFVGLVGTALAVTGGDDGALGLRLAIVGYLVFLFGASGLAASAVFDRGMD